MAGTNCKQYHCKKYAADSYISSVATDQQCRLFPLNAVKSLVQSWWVEASDQPTHIHHHNTPALTTNLLTSTTTTTHLHWATNLLTSTTTTTTAHLHCHPPPPPQHTRTERPTYSHPPQHTCTDCWVGCQLVPHPGSELEALTSWIWT